MVEILDRDTRETAVSGVSRNRWPVIPLVVLVIAQLCLIALTVGTDPAPEPVLSAELAIPESVDTRPPNPSETHSWQPVGVASGDALRPTRIPNGYAFPTPDGVVVLLDGGGAVRSRLPNAGAVRGIAANDERTVVYGSSSEPEVTAPTLWISEDGLSWSTVTLPWSGAVRTVGFDQGRLLVGGFRRGEEGVLGVLARETDAGEWTLQDTPTPASNHFAIEGAFVVRARLEDEPDHRYYATSDFETFTYFADSMIIMSGNVSAWAGVVDLNGVPALRVPQLQAPIVPPGWPVVAVWLEGDLLWIQTPRTLWSSVDGQTWEDIPLKRDGWLGPAMAIPIGDTARVAVRESGSVVRIFEWQSSN